MKEMKQLETGELEFKSFEDASTYFANLLKKEGQQVESANTNNSGTYKDEIVELRNVNYSIPGNRVLSANQYHSQTPFWAISESLSEVLNLTRPIMERYTPAIMDSSYKITPDRMPCYSYGERWHANNQLINIFNRLDNNQTTKRAFMVVYNGLDTELSRPDVPCTIGHHFSIRDNKLA